MIVLICLPPVQESVRMTCISTLFPVCGGIPESADNPPDAVSQGDSQTVTVSYVPLFNFRRKRRPLSPNHPLSPNLMSPSFETCAFVVIRLVFVHLLVGEPYEALDLFIRILPYGSGSYGQA